MGRPLGSFWSCPWRSHVLTVSLRPGAPDRRGTGVVRQKKQVGSPLPGSGPLTSRQPRGPLSPPAAGVGNLPRSRGEPPSRRPFPVLRPQPLELTAGPSGGRGGRGWLPGLTVSVRPSP